jgi:hypothetical protein
MLTGDSKLCVACRALSSDFIIHAAQYSTQAYENQRFRQQLRDLKQANILAI